MLWARCKYFENEWNGFWDTMNHRDYLDTPVEKRKVSWFTRNLIRPRPAYFPGKQINFASLTNRNKKWLPI